MSWDIILFNSSEKINSISNIDEDQLKKTDFTKAIEKNFVKIKEEENYREITGEDFAFEYFVNDEIGSNIMIHLYGENALF